MKRADAIMLGSQIILEEPGTDEHVQILLENFAKQVDNHIQAALVSEIMERYVEVSRELEIKSRELEERDKRLKEYNHHLEDLVREKVDEVSTSQMATIHALIKLSESRDDETGEHIVRTAEYCRFMAEKLLEMGAHEGEIDSGFINSITQASPLHDIGKVGIPDAILLKPGKLTPEEFEVMKTHTTIGHRTLFSIDKKDSGSTFIKVGMEITLCHHEKWDGSGYPRGLKGEEIPISARIMALSDVYDALRSKRVYKEGYSHEKSMEIISQGRGSHFDPLLVDVFLENHCEFRDIFDET
ncbi:MAG: HD domain-containing phosphohydrolase [Lacrimispora sp.]|uniref:HD-GYP domain-containing protein n=1 Tax=Lacrimispora sp. TaxID=2719234 RepID=UPI0039E6EB57